MVMLKPQLVFLLSVFVFAISALPVSLPAARGTELLGYLENWVNVKWWDNNMPGNCYQGCFEPDKFITTTKPYSALNYGFTFLTQNPEPDQLDCSGSHGGKKDPGCPVWDGKALYLSKASKPFSHAVDDTTTIDKPTPSIIAISEVVRMGRMHPDGPKRVKITLGGWSDFARMETAANGDKIAVLIGKMVAYTFADGVDIDMEHLTPFANTTGDSEFVAFAAFVKGLRREFDGIQKNWVANANARGAALQKEYDAMQPWQRNNAKDFYGTNIAYFKEVASNPAPHLEISWCTRFNAFVPKDDPFNYHLPGTPTPNVTYPTDNEGLKLWPEVGDLIDTVNIMAYDAGVLQFNFTTILTNFVKLGNVPATKINMGFEPGNQFAGGHWEGEATDKATGQWIKDNGFGGAMVWAVNPSAKQNPPAAKECPLVATALQEILKPTYAWGNVPNYTKCNPTTGWNPNAPAPKPPTPTPTPTPPAPPGPPSPPSPPSPPGPPGACGKVWAQCGGTHGSCCSGCTCEGSKWYKQCMAPKGQQKC